MIARVVFALIVCVTASTSFADSLRAFGVDLSLDEIASVDAASKKISVDGKSEIVANANVEHRAAELILTSTKQAERLGVEGIISIIKGAIAASDPAIAAQALNSLTRLSDVTAIAGGIKTLRQQPGFGSVARTVLISPEVSTTGAKAPAIVAAIAFAAVWDDAGWAQHEGYKIIEPIRSETAEAARSVWYESLTASNLPEAEHAVGVLTAILGVEDPEVKKATVFTVRLREALAQLDRGNGSELFSLARSVQDNKRLSDLVEPLVVESAHRLGKQALSTGKPEKALEDAAQIDINRRTPTTRTLVLDALSALNGSHPEIFLDGNVASLLEGWSSVDAGIARAYSDALVRATEAVMEQSGPDAAEPYFTRMGAAGALDALQGLRVKQAVHFLDLNMASSARTSLYEVKSLTMWQTLRLTWAGYYGSPLLLFCYLIGFGCFATLAYIRILERLKSAADEPVAQAVGRQPPPTEPIIEDEPVQELKGGFNATAKKMLSPTALEYRRGLTDLGLEGEVTLRQIKSAYRQLVKEVHPDLNANLTQAQKDRFHTLTKVYERTMELRKQMGLEV